MTKNLNWNMLHLNQCPSCRGDLLPLDAAMAKFVCSNATKKGREKCAFSIYRTTISRITDSLRVRVYR